MSYHYKYSKGVVEHNIPMDKVIKASELNIQYKKVIASYYRQYIVPTISEDTMQEISDKIMWTTENRSFDFGTIFVYFEPTEMLVAAELRKVSNNGRVFIGLFPVTQIREDTKYLDNWPYRKVKVFATKEEYLKDREDKEKKKEKKSKEYEANVEEIKKANPEFYLETPKLLVTKVLKPTNKLKAKVNDIIRGKIKVMEKQKDGQVKGCLNGATYTNYVNCYINNWCVKSLPPTQFCQLFEENYIVKIIE